MHVIQSSSSLGFGIYKLKFASFRTCFGIHKSEAAEIEQFAARLKFRMALSANQNSHNN